MASEKLKRALEEQGSDAKMDMSPMIDMVFLLLIFFIVNATAITVKTDPQVEPPAASNGISGDPDGRIVINIRGDGVYTSEDLTVLPDEGAILHYVRELREVHERRAVLPKLHLRGDKESLFKHGRVAVRAAAKAGVDQVIFSAYLRER